MARISQETIDRIRSSADIVDVVSKYVDLKKRGRNYFGLCPFHSERTPSFSVAPEKEIYHCFGCGAGGSVFNFLMEKENLTFVESVQELGKDLGIEVQLSGDSGSKQLFTQLYELHEIASSAYEEKLHSELGKKALEYLTERGLENDTLKKFNVGFAPDSWEFLTDRVRGKGYSRESIDKSGLFGKGKSGVVDRFRSRIMFPIMNRSGRIIAFGGRVFDSDDPAKYMNSPETPLYRKSEVFYGYHNTATSIREEGSAIMVEGYMDFLQLYQSGIHNVLAVSGTAFTDRHAIQIGKITKKVYLMYDGDEAGQKAALRAGYALLKNGIAAFVVRTPEGIDPDDWVRRDGMDGINEGLNDAMPVMNYHLEYSNAVDLPAVERSALVKEILSEIAGVKDGIIRDDLLRTLSGRLNINEDEMIRQFRNTVTNNRRPPDPGRSTTAQSNDLSSVVQKAQVEIIHALLANGRDTKDLVSANKDLFTEPLLRNIIEKLLDLGTDTSSEVLESIEDKEDRELAARILMSDNEVSDPKANVIECILTLKTQPIKDEIKETRMKIREAESSGEDSSELILKVGQLQAQLQTASE